MSRHSPYAPAPSLRRSAALFLVPLVAALAVAGTGPAGAQDGYEPDAQVVAAVRGYAQETGNGYDHVLRWMRVLAAFGAVEDMTAAEAQGYADRGWQRWIPVVTELSALEAGSDHEPDAQVVAAVRGYAQETGNGYDHVLHWVRVLAAFGAVEDMTSAEAQGYADRGWQRWIPVVEELTKLEASASGAGTEPTATPTPTPAPTVTSVAVTSDAGDDDTYALGETITITVTFSEAVNVTGTPQIKIDMDPAEWGEKQARYHSGTGMTALVFTHTIVEPNISTRGIAVLANSLVLNSGSIRSASSQADADLSHDGLSHNAGHRVNWQLLPEPNRAPAVNAGTQNYEGFVREQDAPRGFLVSKSFAGLFTDPDGDELTYSVSVPDDRSRLVESLGTSVGTTDGEFDLLTIEVDADDDWKAVSPALPDPLTITVTLTATDPGGLSISLTGDFVTDWESHPALVSATAGPTAVTLAFDLEVRADPAPPPGQFTVNVVNEDGSAGTVAVSGVSVNGKVVTLHLASALESGQTVTLDYTHDDEAPLKRAAAGGDSAPGFTGRAVDVSLLDHAERTPEPETALQQRAPLQRAPVNSGLRVSQAPPDGCKESQAEHGVDGWRCR